MNPYLFGWGHDCIVLLEGIGQELKRNGGEFQCLKEKSSSR
jgi:hypothetical protein